MPLSHFFGGGQRAPQLSDQPFAKRLPGHRFALARRKAASREFVKSALLVLPKGELPQTHVASWAVQSEFGRLAASATVLDRRPLASFACRENGGRPAGGNQPSERQLPHLVGFETRRGVPVHQTGGESKHQPGLVRGKVQRD